MTDLPLPVIERAPVYLAYPLKPPNGFDRGARASSVYTAHRRSRSFFRAPIFVPAVLFALWAWMSLIEPSPGRHFVQLKLSKMVANQEIHEACSSFDPYNRLVIPEECLSGEESDEHAVDSQECADLIKLQGVRNKCYTWARGKQVIVLTLLAFALGKLYRCVS